MIQHLNNKAWRMNLQQFLVFVPLTHKPPKYIYIHTDADSAEK